jgi:acyl carrier protein
MSNALFPKLKKIVSGEFGVDENEINLDSHLHEDLNADPLSIADLMVKLEEGFGIKIPGEKSSQFVTVSDILDFISEQSGEI